MTALPPLPGFSLQGMAEMLGVVFESFLVTSAVW